MLVQVHGPAASSRISPSVASAWVQKREELAWNSCNKHGYTGKPPAPTPRRPVPAPAQWKALAVVLTKKRACTARYRATMASRGPLMQARERAKGRAGELRTCRILSGSSAKPSMMPSRCSRLEMESSLQGRNNAGSGSDTKLAVPVAAAPA